MGAPFLHGRTHPLNFFSHVCARCWITATVRPSYLHSMSLCSACFSTQTSSTLLENKESLASEVGAKLAHTGHNSAGRSTHWSSWQSKRVSQNWTWHQQNAVGTSKIGNIVVTLATDDSAKRNGIQWAVWYLKNVKWLMLIGYGQMKSRGEASGCIQHAWPWL